MDVELEQRVVTLEIRVEKMDMDLKEHFADQQRFISGALAGVEKVVGARIDELGKRLDARIDRLDARVDGVDARLNGIDAKLVTIDSKLDTLLSRVPPPASLRP